MAERRDPEKVVHEIERKTGREGISPILYDNWSKEILEAGKWRLAGTT